MEFGVVISVGTQCSSIRSPHSKRTHAPPPGSAGSRWGRSPPGSCFCFVVFMVGGNWVVGDENDDGDRGLGDAHIMDRQGYVYVLV